MISGYAVQSLDAAFMDEKPCTISANAVCLAEKIKRENQGRGNGRAVNIREHLNKVELGECGTLAREIPGPLTDN